MVPARCRARDHRHWGTKDGTVTARIAFQGEPGAYGHQACIEARPDHVPLPCTTFEDALEAVRSGDAELGMIASRTRPTAASPMSTRLLPDSGLHIVDEAFVRVHVNLLGLPGATIEGIRRVRAMSILLGQARGFLREHRLETLTWSDNAAAAREVAQLGDPAEGGAGLGNRGRV